MFEVNVPFKKHHKQIERDFLPTVRSWKNAQQKREDDVVKEQKPLGERRRASQKKCKVDGRVGDFAAQINKRFQRFRAMAVLKQRIEI